MAEEDYELVKSLHEENIGVKIDEDEFETILDLAESEVPDIREKLTDLSGRILGALLTLDDFTSRFEYTKMKVDPKRALDSEYSNTRLSAMVELLEQGDVDTVMLHLKFKERHPSVLKQMRDRIVRSPEMLLQAKAVGSIQRIVDTLVGEPPTVKTVDTFIQFLEKTEDKTIIKEVQDYLFKHVKEGD